MFIWIYEENGGYPLKNAKNGRRLKKDNCFDGGVKRLVIYRIDYFEPDIYS